MSFIRLAVKIPCVNQEKAVWQGITTNDGWMSGQMDGWLGKWVDEWIGQWVGIKRPFKMIIKR